MDKLEGFLKSVNLQDADDIDSLLELAAFVRQLAGERQYDCICRLIGYTVERSYYEAFSWVIGIIQEELESPEGALEAFECTLGRSIPDYDEMIGRLQVDFEAYRNGVETVRDHNGEVESFFNVITYRTGYKNIYLVSSENFDTKDNDYVQYKLAFTRE